MMRFDIHVVDVDRVVFAPSQVVRVFKVGRVERFIPKSYLLDYLFTDSESVEVWEVCHQRQLVR